MEWGYRVATSPYSYRSLPYADIDKWLEAHHGIYILTYIVYILSNMSNAYHQQRCSPRYHMDCENIHTLSYYHHQIGSMNYYPLFRVRSWNNDVRCMSFYILMVKKNVITCWWQEMSGLDSLNGIRHESNQPHPHPHPIFPRSHTHTTTTTPHPITFAWTPVR